MSKVKELLERISQSERECLMYAFEQGITEIVILADGQFVGVNVEPSPQLVIDSTEGLWTAGRKV